MTAKNISCREGIDFMRCTCPKCNSNINLELPDVPESGAYIKCTECRAKLLVRKESFAGKACWKSEETSCIHCGSHLAHSIVCPNCSTLFPDYIVNQPSRWKQSETEWWKIFESPTRSRKPAINQACLNAKIKNTSISGASYSKSSLVKAGITLLILVIIITGVGSYRIFQARQKYSEDFFLALYGIKTGSTMCFQSCSTISNAWNNNISTGRNNIPAINTDNFNKLQKIKAKVDVVMQRIENPPSKYFSSKVKLDNVYNIYSKLYVTTTSGKNNYNDFKNSISELDNNFSKAIVDFKSTIPQKLVDDFKIAQAKHKGLKDI